MRILLTKQDLRSIFLEALLLEVTLASVKQSLTSKRAKKIVKSLIYTYNGDKQTGPYSLKEEEWVSEFIDNVLRIVPQDLEDKQQAQCLLWLLKAASRDVQFADQILNFRGLVPGLNGTFETFFHYHHIIENRDLFTVPNAPALIALMRSAAPHIAAYQEKQRYNDAEAGQEHLLSNAQWEVIAIHNKGAACELGKGTKWCTAAPGLEYFASYYRKDDPLIFIRDKRAGERYQLSCHAKQLMDEDDIEVRGPKAAEILQVVSAVDKYGLPGKVKVLIADNVINSSKSSVKQILAMYDDAKGDEDLLVSFMYALKNRGFAFPDHIVEDVLESDSAEAKTVLAHAKISRSTRNNVLAQFLVDDNELIISTALNRIKPNSQMITKLLSNQAFISHYPFVVTLVGNAGDSIRLKHVEMIIEQWFKPGQAHDVNLGRLAKTVFRYAPLSSNVIEKVLDIFSDDDLALNSLIGNVFSNSSVPDSVNMSLAKKAPRKAYNVLLWSTNSPQIVSFLYDMLDEFVGDITRDSAFNGFINNNVTPDSVIEDIAKRVSDAKVEHGILDRRKLSRDVISILLSSDHNTVRDRAKKRLSRFRRPGWL